MEDGTVRAWGSDSAGQLGNGTRHDRATPDTVTAQRTRASASGCAAYGPERR
ncbi:hypothetical protein [Streptomyces daliensis]|uniref:Uncharacterized protein n=1 Tax=Streptomyces daliensis TaxID=299421 RepID=A0A8T4IMP3_9ACTN|nr:hypothetical protein [Streptomyces daliensis]